MAFSGAGRRSMLSCRHCPSEVGILKTHRGKRHSLDLSNLPLVELACLLRRLGRKMLDALLADEPPPDWLCLLSRVDTRVATRMRIRRIGVWRRLAWYPEDLLLNPGDFYRELLRETITRGVRKNKWQREATDLFALILKCSSSCLLATPLLLSSVAFPTSQGSSLQPF